MATQPPPPPPRNGESIQVAVGSKSFGIHAGNLIPILLLLGGIIGGYLIFVALDHRITTLLDGQERMLIVTEAHKDTVLEALHAQKAFLVEQVNASLLRQTARDQEHVVHRAADLEVLQRMLRTHEYNQYQEPSMRLPLDVPPESAGKPKP